MFGITAGGQPLGTGIAPSPGTQPSSAAPWGGLPTAPAPWSGGAEWQAAQQAPWRMSPWQTQGMPSGTPAPSAPTPPPLGASNYLPGGTSDQLQNFNPMVPGGGFYPWLQGQGGAPQQGGGGGQRGPNLYINQAGTTTADPTRSGMEGVFRPVGETGPRTYQTFQEWAASNFNRPGGNIRGPSGWSSPYSGPAVMIGGGNFGY